MFKLGINISSSYYPAFYYIPCQEKTLFPKKNILTKVDSMRMSNTRLTCIRVKMLTLFYCQGGNGNLFYTSPDIRIIYLQCKVKFMIHFVEELKFFSCWFFSHTVRDLSIAVYTGIVHEKFCLLYTLMKICNYGLMYIWKETD